MGKRPHTERFRADVADETIAEMHARRERVDAPGRRVFAETGAMDPAVTVFDQTRNSRNAMLRNPDGTWTLVRGPKVPFSLFTDGTGSMGHLVDVAFEAMKRTFAMLEHGFPAFHPDVAAGVVQDVDDIHPVFQVTQWEGTTVILDAMRKLVADRDGGDPTEDYQYALAYLAWRTQMDIWDHYGLKGIAFIVGDQLGREDVTASGIQKFFGKFDGMLQGSMTTKAVADEVARRFHAFYVHVVEGGYANDEAVRWWKHKFSDGHVVFCEDTNLLAELQAGIAHVIMTREPTQQTLTEFLRADGANTSISDADARTVWGWITDARIPFGAQTLLPGFDDLPKPGSIFKDLRDPWPIGHKNASRNPIHLAGEPEAIPAATDEAVIAIPTASRPPMDWSRFTKTGTRGV